jgi:site-specific recombinase XerD
MDNYIKKFTEGLGTDGKSIHTIIAYKKDLEQMTSYLKDHGVTDPVNVDEDVLRGYFDELKKENLSAKTISRKLNSARTFFKYLQELKIVTRNPAILITHPKISAVIPRVLTELEYRALRDAARPDRRTYLIIEILLQTGIRIGELCRITMDDLHMNKKTATLIITAYGSTSKREIPLNEQAIDIFKEYLSMRPQIAKCDNVFITKNGNPLLVRNIRTSIDNTFKKAGINNAKVNDLRNTFIAHHLARGTNIFILSKIIGHKRIATTEKYLGKIKLANDKMPTLPVL